ncbi:MAG: DEAD/DEAH box helicase, partial [Elusimicrobia bacterium]|nr:DEAD/DEAH box helicase [Elusimicrobiota bacterium]
MILRERQKVFVEKCLKALEAHRNTLGVAPTGGGKTLMLSAVTGRILQDQGGKACLLAHRDELTAQNVGKFLKINPHVNVSIVDSRTKSWTGEAVFAMVQTLARENNLAGMPPVDLLVIDEAHHAQAPIYRRVIDAAKIKNPLVKIFGVTATPNRGDGQGLRDIFDNCADQITLGEMIAAGYLVKPRTFVINLGVQEELKRVRRLASEFDMDEVAQIMDQRPLTEVVIRHWREKAGDRRTVVFCSTVAHAEHVTQAFREAAVATDLVTGQTPEDERAAIFRRLDTGQTQVLVNVAVATEGWDCPPISCVVLLRPCSYKSTMIQMIGRGLRKPDPEQYPGVVKIDCVVLDFGTSALTHGSLEQDVNLDGRVPDVPDGSAPTKECPGCGATVPAATQECPFCGYVVPDKERVKAKLEEFAMTEIDLLKRSAFKWCDVNEDGAGLVAAGFNAWGGVFKVNGHWCAVGGFQGEAVKLMAVGDRAACLASADDWLNLNETEEAAHKSRRWLSQP